MIAAALASIPSPSSGALTIGPLSIHAYGLMIALGVIAAVWTVVLVKFVVPFVGVAGPARFGVRPGTRQGTCR